ncbi:YtzI protein [Peribacillus alkalitolerans]|uniref:YtzI protein n=1 Tax=Peribacillus alkalitolerans TaxID=1550385 RepID=UPI0013D5E1C6|nr:YtzI protein [Peribacillus alkalitolerans]
MMYILVIAIIIIFIVLILSVLTTSKAYDFKHTVDPIKDNPHLQREDENEQKNTK